MTETTGAWFLGGYRKGMTGTLGQSLALGATDNLGWALRALKYELAFNGLTGMVLDSPTLGAAADVQIRLFQASKQLLQDGVVGPRTARELLRARIIAASSDYRVPFVSVDGIVRHESSYDLGAIGYVDNDDRGLTQKHIYAYGSVNISQAIRPALALPRLASQLRRCTLLWDADAAIASWNIGEGGAEWWFSEGKPTSGSPSWWTASDLAARATKYVLDVRSTEGS